MKRSFVIVLLCSIFLMGCSVSTPVGTVTVSYDKEQTTEKVIIKDNKGNTQEIDPQNIEQQIDNMLDDVAVPSGTSNEELKNFVHDSMDNLGLDDQIDSIENTLGNSLSETEQK